MCLFQQTNFRNVLTKFLKWSHFLINCLYKDAAKRAVWELLIIIDVFQLFL